jgi:hypothetical protein
VLLLSGPVTFASLTADPLAALRVRRRALTHPVLLDLVTRVAAIAADGTARLAAAHLSQEVPAQAEFAGALLLTLRATLVQVRRGCD